VSSKYSEDYGEERTDPSYMEEDKPCPEEIEGLDQPCGWTLGNP
jgi:hypothetical protein